MAEQLRASGLTVQTDAPVGTAIFMLLAQIRPDDLVVMTSHGRWDGALAAGQRRGTIDPQRAGASPDRPGRRILSGVLIRFDPAGPYRKTCGVALLP